VRQILPLGWLNVGVNLENQLLTGMGGRIRPLTAAIDIKTKKCSRCDLRKQAIFYS
jgi:hypothetical protein